MDMVTWIYVVWAILLVVWITGLWRNYLVVRELKQEIKMRRRHIEEIEQEIIAFKKELDEDKKKYLAMINGASNLMHSAGGLFQSKEKHDEQTR